MSDWVSDVWFIGWFTDRFIDLLTGWLTDSFIHSFIWLIDKYDWLIDYLIDWTDWLQCPYGCNVFNMYGVKVWVGFASQHECPVIL